MPTVLITGTSTGIGQATAIDLAQRGWRVFATMRDLGKCSALEGELAAKGVREQVEILRLDVTDRTSIDAAIIAITARNDGRLDAVVHNAGIAIAGAFEDVPEADVRRVMETNFFGVLNLTRAVLPILRAQRRGRIVIVSSEAAFFGQPANSVYSASKWAIEGWAEAMAYELEPFAIEVFLIEPGPYRTAIWDNSARYRPENSAYSSWTRMLFRAADRHAATMSRDPAEVARAIATVLESRRPRFRTPVGPLAHVNHFLRGKLPSRFVQYAVARYLGLGRARP